jgi:hypothetical protein
MRGAPPHAGPYAVSAQFRGGSEVGRVGVGTSVTVVEVGSLPVVGGCGVRGERDEGEAVHGRA